MRLSKLKSTKMLKMWRELPNPDYAFFASNGISPHKALQNLSFSPEIQSVILARESAVLGDQWEITGCCGREAGIVKQQLVNIGMDSIFRDIFKAVWYGFAVLEHLMEKKNGVWEFTKIKALPNEWFSFDSQCRLIPSRHDDNSAMIIEIGKFDKEVELIQYRADYSNPYGESLLARVFWSAAWIKGTMDLWISYIDRFGDDAIVGRVDIASEERRIAMLNAISEFRSSGAMVIEGSDNIEILKSDKNSSSKLFGDFYDICTKQISKIFLGHSGSLESHRSFTHSWHAACWVAKADGDHVFVLTPE